jgi:hypothetical protein
MDKEQLAPWLEKLKAAKKKGRNGIVTEMCREHGLSAGEGWALLREAGFDPKAPGADGAEEKKTPVTVRHKTEFPKYRRAGLILTQKRETREVTEAQLAALKKDPWVEVIET